MRLFPVIAIAMLLFGCAQQLPPQQNQSPDLQKFQDKIDSMQKKMDDMQERMDRIEAEVENQTAQPPPPAPPQPDTFRFLVTVQNIHPTYHLLPGVFILHKNIDNFNYQSKLIPSP